MILPHNYTTSALTNHIRVAITNQDRATSIQDLFVCWFVFLLCENFKSMLKMIFTDSATTKNVLLFFFFSCKQTSKQFTRTELITAARHGVDINGRFEEPNYLVPKCSCVR